ncbi:glycosyltransferase family 4 protein [Allorhizobium pseudoryzae]|uniref:glycosyltransferase family 4 protein n=1 Tax=Allorhizobium pseudoryzae TaxID=379684 RepID=UPI003D05727B
MRIACIHQGWELYGSDRSFAESVAALRGTHPDAEIEVVLPRPGPIVDILQSHATRILFEPLWILRRKSLLRLATIDAPRLPIAVLRALRRLRSFDLVYVNTSVIVDYALAARFSRDRTILHIHEIPEGLALKILGGLIRFSGSELIFNSNATRQAFGDPKTVMTHVVYNGVEGPAAPLPVTYHGTRPLRVLLLGRINRIKGQDVLLDAVAALPSSVRQRLEVRIVGSAFESDEPERDLRERIDRLGLGEHVTLLPFIPDPSQHYSWADVVTVPSKRPESLGRVAIEAMAWGRPVIASSIGGLTEVVDHGRTGWTLPPGDPSALRATLLAILDDPAVLAPFAATGRLRYEKLFSRDAVSATIGRIVTQKLARRGIAAGLSSTTERGAAE